MECETEPAPSGQIFQFNPTQRARARETTRAAKVAVKQTEQKPKPRPGDGTPGPGRPKGSQNKTTAFLKDAILRAAEKAGKQYGSEGMVSYLEAQASANPGPFMALLGKVLPMQVGMDPDNPMKVVHRIELVAPREHAPD